MIKINTSKIPKDRLIRELEKEIQNLSKNEETQKLTIVSPIKPKNFQEKVITNIKQLLPLPAKQFLKKAYQTLLLREPDEGGFKYYLNKLYTGEFTKKDVLVRLFLSKERRKKNTKLKGITFYMLYHILSTLPIIGYLVKLIKNILKLPSLEKKLNTIENFWTEKILEINHTTYENKQNIKFLKQEITSLNEHINLTKNHFEKEILEIKHRLSEEDLENIYEETPYFKTDKNLPYYTEFENNFRGDKSTVKEKQKIYLKYVNKDDKVLDLGCGRGEFLELLKENGINDVEGVDLQPYLVEILKKQNYSVYLKDAVDFLQETQQTYNIITSFHLIEHLPEEKQKQLIQLSYEKLKEGGKLIIETPNPYFLHAFGTFYIDQTHIKPISPETLAFLLYWYGFKNVKVLYLQPFTNKKPVNTLKKAYYQDFAVIGEK